MRILGIDYGEARIGLAVSDPLGLIAQMLETIQWKYDIKKPISRIKELVEDLNCDTLIVGLPRNMKDRKSVV